MNEIKSGLFFGMGGSVTNFINSPQRVFSTSMQSAFFSPQQYLLYAEFMAGNCKKCV